MKKEKSSSFNNISKRLELMNERINKVKRIAIILGAVIVSVAIISLLAYYYDVI